MCHAERFCSRDRKWGEWTSVREGSRKVVLGEDHLWSESILVCEYQMKYKMKCWLSCHCQHPQMWSSRNHTRKILKHFTWLNKAPPWCGSLHTYLWVYGTWVQSQLEQLACSTPSCSSSFSKTKLEHRLWLHEASVLLFTLLNLNWWPGCQH